MMAKKKKPTIELSDKKISFTRDGTTYKLIRFYQKEMTLDTMVYEGEEKIGQQKIAFAQLPKELKKELHPN
jgi:hypothetical protein